MRSGPARAGRVVLAVVVVSGCAGSTSSSSPSPLPSARVSSAATSTSGTRLVGLDHAAIAVPESWGTNLTRCGTPQQDTVVIDVFSVAACATGRPAGVDSVEVTRGGRRFDQIADRIIQVDGVRAERQNTTCRQQTTLNAGAFCVGSVYLPDSQVSFRVESSTDSLTVDQLLNSIRITPDSVGVPGYSRFDYGVRPKRQAGYLAALRAAGLKPVVVTRKKGGEDPGFILGVTPPPGSMVASGGQITVTVTAPFEGPADRVGVGLDLFSTYSRQVLPTPTDEQIRQGVTVHLPVGGYVGASIYSANSKNMRGLTLCASTLGTGLQLRDPSGSTTCGHRWKAIRVGTTRITLFVRGDGPPARLGVVTMVIGPRGSPSSFR